jgi:chromosome segregation ATPase
MLQKERSAREEAEELAKRLEESATVHMNGSAVPGSAASEEVSEATEDKSVSEAPEPEANDETPAVDTAQETAAALQSRIDMMESQMRDMREQMEEWKQRCETVESERDADRKTLAEMVVQLRAEEALREAAEKKARSRSRKRDADADGAVVGESNADSGVSKSATGEAEAVDPATADEALDAPTLSRASTITPATQKGVVRGQDQRLQAALPYASMLGVVLFGMGLMAYINGWQAEPPRPEQ